MDLAPKLIDEAVLAFRRRLLEAIDEMGAARGAVAFCAAERAVMSLAQGRAGGITRWVLL